MGSLEISHDVLLRGADFASCRQRVHRFFDRTMLIHYDTVQIKEEEALSGADEKFRARMQQGLAANRSILAELLENLKGEGFATLDDLRGLEKGYLSKILHTIVHLLDGFIGIDSRFYNLEEDSHGVSRDLQQKISANPAGYWILKVTGRIVGAAGDPLDRLRTFERQES